MYIPIDPQTKRPAKSKNPKDLKNKNFRKYLNRKYNINLHSDSVLKLNNRKFINISTLQQ